MKKTYKILSSFFLILISGTGFSQSVPSYVPTNGLIGWWGFNGNAQDNSGNGNHGTVNGATLTTDRFGNQNGAYDFDGQNNRINVTNQNFNLGWQNYTISAWFQLANSLNNFNYNGSSIILNTIPHNGIVITHYGTNNPFSSLVSNNVSVLGGDGTGWNYFHVGPLNTRNNIPPQTWNNILLTRNGNKFSLYLNGLIADSLFLNTSPINQTCELVIGNIAWSYPSEGFLGKLDDYAVWSRTLTPQEITNLYNSQLLTQSSLCLPTITTTSPSSVGVDSVVIGGDISNDGGSSIVLRGICYSTSPNPNMGNQRTEDGSGTGSFNTVLRGLTSSTMYYARSYAKNSNGVVVYGNEVSFTTTASLPGLRCPGTPTVTDIDGNIYNTLQIGGQCWTQSNLKTSRYRNGDTIANNLPNIEWSPSSSISIGAYCFYNDQLINDSIYGKLYNYNAVVEARGLCPTGWHVPTDAEWTDLVLYLDPTSSTLNSTQSNFAGGFMKSTNTSPMVGGWSSPNNGATNMSGFSALPGDIRNGGYGGGLSMNGFWWSTTPSQHPYAWSRSLYYFYSHVYRTHAYKNIGMSVRCLKD